MKTSWIASFLCLLFCAGTTPAQKIKSSFDPASDLSNLKTFDFGTIQRRAPGDLVEDNSLTDKRIKRALESQLIARGFVRATGGMPDFKIVYYTTAKTQTGTHESPINQNDDLWPLPPVGSRTETILEGTFVFDFTDTRSGRVVWRGQVKEIIDREKPVDKINRAVAKLVKQFAKDAKRNPGG